LQASGPRKAVPDFYEEVLTAHYVSIGRVGRPQRPAIDSMQGTQLRAPEWRRVPNAPLAGRSLPRTRKYSEGYQASL
jgi:hypothetical protein